MLGSKQNLLWVWKHLNTSCVYLRLGYFDSVQYVSRRYFLVFTHHLGCLNSGCCLTNSLSCHGHGKDPSRLPQAPVPISLPPFCSQAFCNREAQSLVWTKSTKKEEIKKKRGKNRRGESGTAAWVATVAYPSAQQAPNCGMNWLCLNIIWFNCAECLPLLQISC